MGSAIRTQIQRNTRAQADLATEFGLLTAPDLAAMAPGNSASAALQWVEERRVFCVDVDGTERFPGFQFDAAGRPRLVIAAALAAFAGALSSWELALWFAGSNGWLGGRRPVDVMAERPGAVVAAAGHLAAELAEAG